MIVKKTQTETPQADCLSIEFLESVQESIHLLNEGNVEDCLKNLNNLENCMKQLLVSMCEELVVENSVHRHQLNRV